MQPDEFLNSKKALSAIALTQCAMRLSRRSERLHEGGYYAAHANDREMRRVLRMAAALGRQARS